MRWKKRHDGEQQTYTARGADETKWIKDDQVWVVHRGFALSYNNVDSVNEPGDEHPGKPGDNHRELQPKRRVPSLVAENVAHPFAEKREKKDFNHNIELLLVAREVTPDQVANNEAADADVGGISDVFPQPAKATMQFVVVQIGFCRRLGLPCPLRAQHANLALLYRPEKLGCRFLSAVWADL